MNKPKRPKKKESVLDSIRKPTAPPSQKMASNKKDKKRDPVGRNLKHKGNIKIVESEE